MTGVDWDDEVIDHMGVEQVTRLSMFGFLDYMKIPYNKKVYQKTIRKRQKEKKKQYGTNNSNIT